MTISNASNRSAARLQLILAEEQVEVTKAWLPHDITGDGKNETFCNRFTRQIATKMGVLLPPLLANDLSAWLAGPMGKAAGWERATAVDAQAAADQGSLAVATWINTNGPGHIAPLGPSLGEPGVWLCNVGASNFTRCPVSRAFGNRPVTYFVHP